MSQPSEPNSISHVAFELYDRMGLRSPRIISCESPWQLMLMPVLLPVLLRGENACRTKDKLFAELMPKVNRDVRLHLWHRLLHRLDRACESLNDVPMIDMEHMLMPDTEQFSDLLQLSKLAQASHQILSDLNLRIQRHYNEIDPELPSESLKDQLHFLLSNGYDQVLNQYLLKCNGLYLPSDPQSASLADSIVVRFRPDDLSSSFLYTQLARIINSIQFLQLGDDGWACLLFPHVCLILEPPSTLSFDSTGRLHCDTGPALAWTDGFTIYAQKGKLVKRHATRSHSASSRQDQASCT